MTDWTTNSQYSERSEWVTIHGALLRSSVDFTIPDSTSTLLSWNKEEYNTEGSSLHSTSTLPSRITIPLGSEYNYAQFFANVVWDTNSTGIRSIEIYKNGAGSSILPRVQGPGTNGHQCMVSSPIPINPGDYFEVVVYQNSTVSVTIFAATDRTYFGIRLYKPI